MTGTRGHRTIVVIPCAAAKTAHDAPAADLYTSANFRHTLTAARHADADRILILSARHGLVDLDTVLAPYDTTMADADSVTPDYIGGQLAGLFGDDDVTAYAMLPAAYLARLTAGAAAHNDRIDADAVLVHDVYEARPAGRAGGIGYTRGAATSIIRHDLGGPQ